MFDDIVKEKGVWIEPGIYTQEYESLTLPILNKKYPSIIRESKKVDREIHPNFPMPKLKPWWSEFDIEPISFDETGELKDFLMPIDEVEMLGVCKEGVIIDDKAFEDEEIMRKSDNPFAEARYIMSEFFNTDDDLYNSYQANIAMFLADRCNITNHNQRNKLAKELMSLLWEC